ncbi:MAG: hypothetical protein L0Y43_03100, partial [Methylococcaceae bacterium]|nr:hypothetical protein [Methylococcaceae bacterium]
MTRKFVCVTKSNGMVFPHLSAVIFLFRLTRVSRPIVTGPGSGIRALGHRIIEIEEIRMLYHCGGNSP